MKAAVEKVRAAAEVPIHINLFVERPAPEVMPDELRAAANAIAPAFEALGVGIPEKLPAPYCPDLSRQIEAALALRPAVLSSHFNPFAPEVIREAQKNGIVVAGSATTLDEAQELEALGVDFIIAQGSEAGGHRGSFSSSRETGMIGSLALIRLIVKRCRVPVVAAGGIMDGAGIAAVLALGAQAAQMGTAFIPCPESGAPAQHKKSVLESSAGTAITRAFSGRAASATASSSMPSATPGRSCPSPRSTSSPYRCAPSRTGRERRSMWRCGPDRRTRSPPRRAPRSSSRAA